MWVLSGFLALFERYILHKAGAGITLAFFTCCGIMFLLQLAGVRHGQSGPGINNHSCL